MDEAPLAASEVPRECEIIELVYHLARGEETHIDLAIKTKSGRRRLRFRGPRVVQFAEDLPSTLHGIDTQDLESEKIGGLSLWISLGGGAVTFWAKSVAELTFHRADPNKPKPALADPESLRGQQGVPVSSFVYRPATQFSRALRHFSISTRPFGAN